MTTRRFAMIFGIVFLIVGSYVPALYYGLFCHPRLMSMYMSAVRFENLSLDVSRLSRLPSPQSPASFLLLV